MNRNTRCAFGDSCPCTHTGPCVAGWIDHEDEPVTSPCPMCRPDLYREMAVRHYRRGEGTGWIRALSRPMTGPR